MESYSIDNTTTFRDYIRVIFSHKAVIISCFVVVMLTVFFGLQMKTPVYEAQVRILISAQKQIESPYYNNLSGYRGAEVSLTQSELVKSTPVIVRTVNALKLYMRPFDYEKNFASGLKKMMIAFKLNSFNNKLNTLTPEQQQALLFRKAMEELKQNISVEPVRDTNIFAIKVREFDPLGAAITANVISRSYIIFDLEQQLAELALKYGKKYPMVKQLETSIENMRAQLAGNPLPDMEAMGPASVKIIEQATVPLKTQGPPKSLILMLAFFMSIFLGVMLAFIFEYMDQSFKTPQDIEQFLNLPFFGSIPKRKMSEKLLIRNIKGNTPYTHFYQILADQLYLCAKDKKLKSILIAAAEPREGVSTIIANLGLYLSQKAGHSVLLIDANFRYPRLHKFFKIKKPGGLADVIEEKAEMKDVVTKIDTNLHVLPAGNTELNPVILLDSSTVEDIIKTAKEKYELILIDCPNLTAFKDGIVLAGHVDGSALVVSEGKTRRQVAKSAIDTLKDKKTMMFGVILNNRTFPIPRLIYKIV